MGAAQSQPTRPSTSAAASLSEKYPSLAPSARRDRSAQDLLAQLCLGKASASSAVTNDNLTDWQSAFESNPKHRLAQTVLVKSDFTQALTSRTAVVPHTFNVKLSAEGSPVTNQKSSGRCWLFAATNTLRIPFAKKANVGEFEFSQSYLFFYDSLSKANYFLENMLELAEEPLDSREVQFLMESPENDGGQWDMAVNLIETFGLVPQHVFPESFTSSATGKIDSLLTSKLREYALELRALHADAQRSLADLHDKSAQDKRALAIQAARKRKAEQLEEVYRILAISCGTPPKPDEAFTWEYYDKDDKYHSLTATPKEFYAKHVKPLPHCDVAQAISLVHDPRTPADSLMTVARLGNVWGARPVKYVATDITALKDAAIALLKADVPVWFGCDVGKSSSTALGLMTHDLFDLPGAFGTGLGMSKEERLRTGDSAMTHAMTLTAVHLDEKTGRPVRWRVENSWGPTAGEKGYMLMSDAWFDMNVYQIVVDRAMVPKKLRAIFEKDTADVVLPPWDPMGSLA